MIKLGFALPQFGPLGQAGRVAPFAAEAERLGARSLWVGDRLLAPVHPTVGYAGGDTIPAEFRSALDPFAVLTAAAAVTERAMLGCSVLNLPWYAPAVIARSLTTIDVLSGGRLLPGFGIGWSPDEYEAAGVPWRGRGARLDESLDALEAWWTANPVEYRGSAVTVPESHVDLRPARRPPIYLGGGSEAALRRVGRRADGWLPAVRVPGRRAVDLLHAQRAVVREAAAAVGRGDLPVALRVNVLPGAPVARVADELADIEAATGIEDMFVELTFRVSDVDDALELAAELLDLVA
jgi:probable F420-dependent oxidoreductase